MRLVVLEHPLDVGAEPWTAATAGQVSEVDVGEEAPGPSEDEDAPAHLDGLLQLVRHEDRGVALGPRELHERLAQRCGGDLVEDAQRPRRPG